MKLFDTNSDFPYETRWTKVLLPDGFWLPKYDWCVAHGSGHYVAFRELEFQKIVNFHHGTMIAEYPIYFENEQDAIIFSLKFGVVK